MDGENRRGRGRVVRRLVCFFFEKKKLLPYRETVAYKFMACFHEVQVSW